MSLGVAVPLNSAGQRMVLEFPSLQAHPCRSIDGTNPYVESSKPYMDCVATSHHPWPELVSQLSSQ